MELTLSYEERELLIELLEERHRQLLREISHTHHHEFRVTLKKHEQVLEGVIGKLRALHHPELAGVL